MSCLALSCLILTTQVSFSTSGTISTNYNINKDGIKKLGAIGSIDKGFLTVQALYDYLKIGSGTSFNVPETTLDNLFKAATGRVSNINFEQEFSSGDNKINDVINEFTKIITYIEDITDADVFNVIAHNKNIINVTPNLVTRYRLNNSTNFYKKAYYINSLPIFTNQDYPDQWIKDAADIMRRLLVNHDDIANKLFGIKFFVILERKTRNDSLSDTPDGKKGGFYNGRYVYTRGEGLGLAHEMLHAMDSTFRLLSSTYPNYQTELNNLYNTALSAKTTNHTVYINKLQKYGIDLNYQFHFLTSTVQNFYGLLNRTDRTVLLTNSNNFKNDFQDVAKFIREYYGNEGIIDLNTYTLPIIEN